MPAADNKDHLQELIGADYQLQWVIGHGGMSTVWLADDVRNDREVAIKVLRPEFSDNVEFLSRFRNEAEAAESIDSENVVATYDYRELEDNGRKFCFMALEYVRGESLADLLAREGALDEAMALDVLEQAAHGLSIIHRMNLVHRDIKPGNLMITQNGQVKITDFGIAKAAAAVPLTRTGMVVGTAQYVSPEQAQGLEVEAASDVYSLGVVGYEMLAGKRPFSGDSSVSVALAHINQAPEALSTSISAPARELIGITLRKDPTTRYVDGNEMALAVSAVRLGKRPPQPQSAALAGVAPEPSPTASTEMLANVANPTTMQPAAPVADTKRTTKKNFGGKNFGVGLLIALGAAALLGGGYFLANLVAGEDDGDGAETSSPDPVTVTEYSDPVTTEVVTPEQEPQEEEPTRERETTNRQDDEPERNTPTRREPTQEPTFVPRPTQQTQPRPTTVEEEPTEQPEESNPLDSLEDAINNAAPTALTEEGN